MRTVLPWAIVATIAALGFLVFADGTAEIIGFELVVILVLVLALRPGGGPRRRPTPDFRYRRRHEDRLPPQLVELERLVGFSQTSIVDYQFRLLPRLRSVVDERLLGAYGYTVEDSPQRAQRVIGEEGWKLLIEGGSPADDVSVPGPSLEQLSELVTTIENISEEGWV